jgi:hypothetical protein
VAVYGFWTSTQGCDLDCSVQDLSWAVFAEQWLGGLDHPAHSLVDLQIEELAVAGVLLASLGTVAYWELSASVQADCEDDPFLAELWLTACESDPAYLERCLGVALAEDPCEETEVEAEEAPAQPSLPLGIVAGSVRGLVELWEARAGGVAPGGLAQPAVAEAGGEGEALALSGGLRLDPPPPPPRGYTV